MMEQRILDMAKAGPVAKQAQILRVTDKRFWRVIMYYTEKCREFADFSACKNLGIDETSKKGHCYLTSFVDLNMRKIMYIADGRDNKTVTEFAKDFTKHKGNCDNIINTTCDMSLAYEKGIKNEFKNSKIIIDKFHIVKYFNDALNKTLRDDIKSGLDFKSSKYIWMKNRENLTVKQEERFVQMNKQNSKTAKAYLMKISMQQIYAVTEKKEAEKQLKKLTSWMQRSRNEHMKKLAKTILNHWDNIMNYFDDRLTNAILEGLNNSIQSIKHTGRGFKNNAYLKAICYLHHGAFKVSVK